MLAQILREMYVDPDLLEELPEEQKQILFVKMREEQIRRYNEREKEFERQENNIKPKPKKENTVNYLIAADGNPWVWVMEDGVDIEQKAKEAEIQEDQLAEQRAMELAHREAGILLKKEKDEINEEEQRLKEEAEKDRKLKLVQEEARRLARKALEDKRKLEEEKKDAEKKMVLERRQMEEKRKMEEAARRKVEQEKAVKEKAEMEERMRRIEEKRRESEKKAEQKRQDDLRNLEKKRQEEEMRKLELQRQKELKKYEEMKRAEELARQQKEEKARKREEEESIRLAKEEKERMRWEREEKLKLEKEALLKARELEEEQRILEEQQKLEEIQQEKDRKRKEELRSLRKKRLAEKEKREGELVQQERRRAQEIYISLKHVREQVKKKEAEEKKKADDAWKASELKAKEAERERRNSVSMARHEVIRERALAAKRRNTLGKTITIEAPPSQPSRAGSISTRPYRAPPPVPSHPPPPVPAAKKPLEKTRSKSPPPRPPLPGRQASLRTAIPEVPTAIEKPPRYRKPKSRNDVIDWFREDELPKRACYMGDKILPYFHGIVSRQDAEGLLLDKKTGSFLVRVSERVWGYTITYRADGRCKHYLVDTSENTYQFFGHNQIAHPTLNDLIDFHKIRPISGMGQELLQYPCGQQNAPPDYEELLIPPASKEMTYL